MPQQAIHLICAECGKVSEREAEGWRAYTATGTRESGAGQYLAARATEPRLEERLHRPDEEEVPWLQPA
jgi:hypothetical protein